MNLIVQKWSYVELAKELAQGVKLIPKTFDELSQKARNYTSLLEKLNKTQEKMASIRAKQLTVLRQVSATKFNVIFAKVKPFVRTVRQKYQNASDNACRIIFRIQPGVFGAG